MKTTNTLQSFASFLAAWQAAGGPQWLESDRKGYYIGFEAFETYSCNHVMIDKSTLPEDICALIPKQEGNGYHSTAIIGPSWTQAHGIVLDVSYSAYCNGWSLMGVATYIPSTQTWVHPSKIHSYRYD